MPYSTTDALNLQELNAETFKLYGRMAVITGAASGIGQAIAHKFAANGASVCLLDINRKHAETVADEITNAGGTASAYECDVSDRVSIGSTFDTILQQGRVHILVNNAGVSHIGTVESTTELDFDRVFRVNVKGYFNCINAVIGRMKSAGGGVILNMAKDSTVYAMLLGQPKTPTITLKSLSLTPGSQIYLLGQDKPLVWSQQGDNIRVRWPSAVSGRYAYVLKVIGTIS